MAIDKKLVTWTARFQDFIDRHRVHAAAVFAVLAIGAFVASQISGLVQQWVEESGIVLYVALLVVLDVAVSLHLLKRTPSIRLRANQDESLQGLISAVDRCKHDTIDLLEYAAATTLPLVRRIQREGIPLRLLIKHPETIEGIQKQRMIATLDTIYNSIYDEDESLVEIRCYRLPYGLRARRLGKQVLELGWLTPDLKRQTAYGHQNPSVVADLSSRSNDHLRTFFDRTFDDLWNASDTEGGRSVLQRLQAEA